MKFSQLSLLLQHAWTWQCKHNGLTAVTLELLSLAPVWVSSDFNTKPRRKWSNIVPASPATEANQNKVTPPAMTPLIFTLFSAAKSRFSQPFQCFVSRAFCVDLQFGWYLHDFRIVLMMLHWWKCALFGYQNVKQNCMFVVFHLQVFAKVPNCFNWSSFKRYKQGKTTQKCILYRYVVHKSVTSKCSKRVKCNIKLFTPS